MYFNIKESTFHFKIHHEDEGLALVGLHRPHLRAGQRQGLAGFIRRRICKGPARAVDLTVSSLPRVEGARRGGARELFQAALEEVCVIRHRRCGVG